MNDSLITASNRRDFISKMLPACGILCAASPAIVLADMGEDELFQQENHKFDTPVSRVPTQRQLMRMRYGEIIRTGLAMKKEFGDERTIDFLKKVTEERMFNVGKRQAEREGKTDFNSYTKTFSDPNAYKTTLTMEILEDTDTAFEIKVSECIWATTFLERDAGDIGFAVVCHGDYAWPQGFNSRISMVRDKTLMEGHDYCNHRYIWTD